MRSYRVAVTRGLAWIAMSTLLFACGDSQKPAIVVSPTSITRSLEEGQTTSVSAFIRNDGTAPLTYSISEDIVGVSLDGVGVTDLAPGAVDSFEVNLSCSSAGDRSGDIVIISNDADKSRVNILVNLTCTSGDPQGIEVTGRIASGSGTIVPDVFVSVAGRAPVTPDADGAFAASGVTVPYDVVVYSLADGWAHVFEDLESASPTLVPLASSGISSGYSVAGVEVTIPLTISSGQELVVCVESALVPVAPCATFTDADAPPFEASAFWEGEATLDATVRAVLYDVDANGFATLVAGMGTTSVSLVDQTIVAASVPFLPAPPAAASIALDVDVPLGYALGQAASAILLPSNPNTVALPSGTPAALPVSILGPVIPDATRLVFAVATGPGSNPATSIGWIDDVEAAPSILTPVDLTLNAAPQLVEPFSGATGVTAGTAFRVDDAPDQAHTFLFSPDTVGPSVRVTSVDGTVTLPDLSGLSTLLGWPAGATYTWRVYSGRPFPDAAAYADGGGGPGVRATRAQLANVGFLPAPLGDGTATLSGERTFVLLP